MPRVASEDHRSRQAYEETQGDRVGEEGSKNSQRASRPSIGEPAKTPSTTRRKTDSSNETRKTLGAPKK